MWKPFCRSIINKIEIHCLSPQISLLCVFVLHFCIWRCTTVNCIPICNEMSNKLTYSVTVSTMPFKGAPNRNYGTIVDASLSILPASITRLLYYDCKTFSLSQIACSSDRDREWRSWSLLPPPLIVFCFVLFVFPAHYSLRCPHFLNTWNKLHTLLISRPVLCGKDCSELQMRRFVPLLPELKTFHCRNVLFIWQKPDDMRSSHSRVNADDVIEQIFSG